MLGVTTSNSTRKNVGLATCDSEPLYVENWVAIGGSKNATVGAITGHQKRYKKFQYDSFSMDEVNTE
jgi:hypothetical protein